MGWANYQQGQLLHLPAEAKKQQQHGPKPSQLATVKSNDGKPLEGAKLVVMLQNLMDKANVQWKNGPFKGFGENKWSPAVGGGGGGGGRERDETVSWLYQVHADFHFYPETLVLATAVLDTFLHTVKVKSKYLKCVATTSLFIACKTTEEEEDQPSCSELIERSACACTNSDILRMERLMLDKLNWQINLATALDFLQLFHGILMCGGGAGTSSSISASRQLTILTNKLLVCLRSHQLAAGFQYRASTLALSILSLELEHALPQYWLPATCMLQRMISLDNHDLIRCRELVGRYLSAECLDSCGPSSSRVMYYQRCLSPLSPNTPTPTARAHTIISGNGGVKRKPGECGMAPGLAGDVEDIYDSIKRLYSQDDLGSTNNILPV